MQHTYTHIKTSVADVYCVSNIDLTDHFWLSINWQVILSFMSPQNNLGNQYETAR